MSEHRKGSVHWSNTISGISTVVCANSTKISMLQNPFVRDILLFNTTTKELKFYVSISIICIHVSIVIP